MCGIAGIYGSEKCRDTRCNEIKQMVSALQHRGPDGWGYYISPDIALGHTRLSIVDLSTGDQPLATDKHVIAFNGEIFNFIELRLELEKRGISFKKSRDS